MSIKAKIQRNYVILLDSANVHQPRIVSVLMLQIKQLFCQPLLHGKISFLCGYFKIRGYGSLPSKAVILATCKRGVCRC